MKPVVALITAREARGLDEDLPPLELTEPSLFFAHASGSADRFAAAVVKLATR